jgi:hypothetical protein
MSFNSPLGADDITLLGNLDSVKPNHLNS